VLRRSSTSFGSKGPDGAAERKVMERLEWWREVVVVVGCLEGRRERGRGISSMEGGRE